MTIQDVKIAKNNVAIALATYILGQHVVILFFGNAAIFVAVSNASNN